MLITNKPVAIREYSHYEGETSLFGENVTPARGPVYPIRVTSGELLPELKLIRG